MIPFFFIGSRRSGTTLVCHLINMNKHLYVPFERYIMWILQCIRTNKVIKAPVGGALAAMLVTFDQAGDAFLKYIQSDFGIEATRSAFFRAMNNVRMRRGTGNWRDELVAVGEKNPPEYAQPGTNDFLLNVFPEAVFIHIVRHPSAVCQSQFGFRHPDGWNNVHTLPPEWRQAMDLRYQRWVSVERAVQEVKKKVPVLTVRYEDLCRDPVHETHKIYSLFGLASTDYTDRRIAHVVKESANSKYATSIPAGTEGIEEFMDMYGYEKR